MSASVGSTTLADAITGYVQNRIDGYPRVPVHVVTCMVAGVRRQLLLKLEGRSPWRSIKGRTALSLLRSVAPQVRSTRAPIVESTSGNLGVALSAVCRDVGLPFIAVVDHRLSPVIEEGIRANGGRLDVVQTPEGASTHLLDRIDRVRQLLEQLPDAVWPNQYENAANWQIHESWTAPEIDEQVGAAAQAVFVGISTGGTLEGIARYYRRARPATRIVAVDVVGSTALGGRSRPRILTGIGASRRSSFVRDSSYEQVVRVPEDHAIAGCHVLKHDTGLAVGGSSGAVLAACLAYLRDNPAVTSAVCVCPDLGENYAQSVYHQPWLARIGLAADPELLRARMDTDFAVLGHADWSAHMITQGAITP